jgi:hypothetical protein
MEQRGKGAASASVTSWLEPGDDGSTRVNLKADVTLSGAVAQLSRGLLPEVSRKLTAQFAECLRSSMGELTASPSEEPMHEPNPSRPVGGLWLGLSAFWASIVRALRRLFGSK